MRRREFIRLIGGASTWSLAARAQQPIPVVGFLSSRSPGESGELVGAFRKGLRQIGFIEGQNVIITHFAGPKVIMTGFQHSPLISSMCMQP